MNTEQIYKLYLESAGVVTDSRNISKNQIFFALWGEKFNGNEYAASALQNGASWAVIDDPQYETDRTILVDDCLLELQMLAAHHRKQMNIPVIAVTGTNGKTTTKELMAAVLQKKFKVHYTRGNLNNHIGVPLTILAAPAGTELMIIEMGANHIGEIKALCQIANPDYGLITNIGTAHIEGFGSFQGVVKAKTELYEHLKKVNGVAFYNDKDPLLTEKIFSTVNRAVPYSDPSGMPLVLDEMPSEMTVSVTAKYNHESCRIDSNLFGKYNYWNLKAAIAAGLFFEVDLKSIADAIHDYNPANNRSQIRQTENNTLVCDSYNANPSSMKSALESFSMTTGNKLVILGDMLELGETSEQEHSKIIERLRASGISNALLVGPVFSKVSNDDRYTTFADVNALKTHLENHPLRGYTILIKGSRGIGLERIYDLL
jgi:UDP-N-acetylmuramoyl-tripeptide--D-alanyl-D-alanine ligase